MLEIYIICKLMEGSNVLAILNAKRRVVRMFQTLSAHVFTVVSKTPILFS
jgi:hypothetical protein